MRKNTLLLLFTFALLPARAQQAFPKKIRVILLGTFHYGETSDQHKTGFPDLFSNKRQQELEIMASSLAAIHPTKIFVEIPPARQQRLDSLRQQYASHQAMDSGWLRNEVIQLGCRTALKASAKLIAADYRQELPYDTLASYEKLHDKDTALPFFAIPWPFSDSGRLKLKDTDLGTYYKQLNDEQSRQRSQFDYLHYSLGYGNGSDYTGVLMSTSWYSRNFKILTNIFRTLESGDNCIIVLMGSAHTALLYELLKDHPLFQLVEVKDVLR